MKNKKGAASFYIVAFSTLVLVIVATSFATVILSEVTRSMNDDLAQSAYDSALAGVEDAKIAFSNYQRCLEAGSTVASNSPAASKCETIMYQMAHPNCNMVAKMLYGIDGEVEVGGVSTGSGTTTNQAYTCVKIATELSDYRSSLGQKTGNYVQTIRAGVADGGTNTVNKIRFSWYMNKTGVQTSWTNVVGGKGVFRTFNNRSLPPIIEMQIVQTGTSFKMSDFDITQSGNRTNRATLYLLPSNTSGVNTITADKLVKSNNHMISNQPNVVRCADGGEFWCSVDIELPEVINGGPRDNDTFLISVSIPYKEPDADFAIELICSDGSGCGGQKVITPVGTDTGMVRIKNTQVAIESTGRANDLYRRVETRLESSDTSFGIGKDSPFYALMILGNGGVNKNMTVRYENRGGPFYF